MAAKKSKKKEKQEVEEEATYEEASETLEEEEKDSDGDVSETPTAEVKALEPAPVDEESSEIIKAATNESTIKADIKDGDSQTPAAIAKLGADKAASPTLDIAMEANEDRHTSSIISIESTASKRLSAKPRPLSQRLASPTIQARDRSSSPGRFPVRVDGNNTPRSTSPALGSGQASPAKRGSIDASITNNLPPSAIDITQAQTAQHPADQASPPLSGGMFRKASSGIGGLFGRMGGMGRTALSPPPARGAGVDRRNSTHSASGPDRASVASLAALVNGGDGVETSRPSLQDRFRTLRELEEQHEDDGQHNLEDDNRTDEQNENGSTTDAAAATRTKRASSTQSQLKTPAANPDLPPGTASGMSAGPSSEPAPVNWDLWQTVVYEGPAAVARTSGEELASAIASGIPAAIRGVVWQVLAESKSEELESLYKTLKTRGSEPDTKPPPPPRQDSEISQTEKTSTSSRSSISSTSSEPTASSLVTTPSASVESSTADVQHKLLAEKQKREAAALQKLEKAIKRDLGSRTSYSKYTQSAGLQDGLFGVCKAYALFDTPVGYAQGINFIAMPLLFNMPEEEAFTLLVRMMHHYQLRSLFEPEMPGLHLRLYQFERLLEDREPALYCHLKRRHVSPQLYATQWFLTLFAYRFPLQLVLRVYDVLFCEGLTAILKFGLVLMQKNRDALLEMKDMGQLTTFLKEKLFDAYIDKSPSASSILDSGFFGSVTGGADKELYRADELVQDATHVNIPKDALHAYEVEWQEQRQIDRDREAELDNLRTSNSTLLTNVKTLEERVQQHDTEHVAIASDLVKYKVENNTLHDAKEALEMQVQELQKMIEKQPAEVEQKLKAEMDRIMQRNLEVQNENRHLQDELENAEQHLVKMSVTHAETQAELDTIKQKWSGVQAMMNGK